MDKIEYICYYFGIVKLEVGYMLALYYIENILIDSYGSKFI